MELSTNVVNLLNELKRYSIATYEHSVRVANLCSAVGLKLDLSEDEIEKLKIGGLLHDIGKLKIPLSILEKPARLTFAEYEEIKKHPKYGVDLLTNAGCNDMDILNMVWFHHERPDGLGYPNELKGDEIPDLVGIITICDCFDAMRSKRVYKERQDINYIKNELLTYAGKQFDSNYAFLLLSYLGEDLDNNRHLIK